MPRIGIVTDSCASIPDKLCSALGIRSVAYYIHRGQEVLRDLVTINTDELLRWLVTARVLPTTASPGPGDYLTTYEQMAQMEGVEEIVSIHMTSKGSGAYQAARVAQSMAQEQLPRVRIEVIDTLNVALCQGWMAIEAARAAMAGKSFEEILALVRSMIPITRMIQTADTLKYLYMGGRIGRAQHLVGTLLNIKPLISMTDGVITPVGVARSRQRAYEMMAEMVETAVGTGRVKIAYMHAGAAQEVERLREMVEQRVNCVESFVAVLSPALAVHSGPGTAGLCYYPVNAE